MLAALLFLLLGGVIVADDYIDQYKPDGVDVYVNSASHTQEEPESQEAYNPKAKNSNPKSKSLNSKIKDLDSYSIMTVDAEDWLCHYADNSLNQTEQIKIKNNWKDKMIKLKGKIYNIKYDQMDGCRITIRQQRSKSASDGWCIISCYFVDKTEVEKVMDLHKGDYVSIVGFSRWDIGPILINSYVK